MDYLGFCLKSAVLIAVLIQLVSSHDPNTTSVYEINSDITERASSCEKANSQKACDAGSRMYRLLSYDVLPSDILFECKAACNESYKTESELDSCKAGCLSQVAAVADRQNQLSEYEKQAGELANQAQMQQLMSRWMFEMLAGFDLFNDWYDDTDFESVPSTGSQFVSTYVFVQQTDDELRIRSYSVAEPSLSTDDYSLPLNSGQINPYVDSDDEDFEPCFYMTGYSKWVLCFLLMISAMFLVWLTCSTVSTSPKHRVSSDASSTGHRQMPEKTDAKLTLKMMETYHPYIPVAVHKPCRVVDDDEKMLLA